MNIILEGILSIQAGENPKSIEVKLVSMLEPKQRIAFEKSNSEKQK
jgi:chemotaxis protein MotA